MKVNDVLCYLDSLAPFSTAESWDNSGLIIGDRETEVTGILVSLDVTNDAIEAAIKEKANLIVAHHPVIFGGISSVATQSGIYKAIKAGISVIGFHTCYDKYAEGVSFILAKAIGLSGIVQNKDYPFIMLGDRIYQTTIAFIGEIKMALDTVVVYTDSGKPIRKVAACGGSGGEYIEEVARMGADAYVTGECKYHDFLKAKELGITLVAAGHYETEVLSVPLLAKQLSNHLPESNVITFCGKSPISVF